ncbi:MAG: hypothetical protein HYU30_03010 [Chloroflexi bacterium]|nr:hypothetical protein [Chloroflexota bacterium]
MPLTQSRIPIIIGGLILLIGLIIAIGGAASADPAQDNPFGDDAGADFGWNQQVAGELVGIDINITDAVTSPVFAIEVFLKNTATTTATPAGILAGTKPAFTQTVGSGGSFPTNQILKFVFDLSTAPLDIQNTALKPLEVAGIHLMGPLKVDGTRNRIRTSSAPVNPGLLVPVVLPAPPADPTPTPVPTVIVPDSAVTAVTAPAGGAAKIVQPNAAATLSAPDGSVSVDIPAGANAKTFQLTYAPLTAGVPAASPKTKVLRAFELTAYDTDGTRKSLTLLSSATVRAKYTSADSQAAPDKNSANLRLLSYDADSKVWSILNTTVDFASQTLIAKTSHFSIFAVGSADPGPQTSDELIATPTPSPTATPTPTPKPPVTGDFTPGSGAVFGLMLLGLLMAMGGAAYLMQVRRARV